MDHFNQKRKRRAEFIKIPNTLKARAGSGGLSEEILEMAQTLLENNTTDFSPMANTYLDQLFQGIESARVPKKRDTEEQIAMIIYPAMQLKANGSMFQYPLITLMAQELIEFLEVIDRPDPKVLEICYAFYTTMRAVVSGGIKGNGGKAGQKLLAALTEACNRYFQKKPA